MRIAICDDEAIFRAHLLDIAEDYREERKDKKIFFEFFQNHKLYWKQVARLVVSIYIYIYILDIVMPDINGIQLGSILRYDGIDGKIIYLTSSEEYALDSFRVKAFDYILKPITKEAFYKAIDEAINSIHIKRDKSAIIKTKDGIARVSFNSILYVESSNRALIYHLTGGTMVESTTLRGSFATAVSELLADSRFVCCGVSIVVNLHHITSVENEGVVFHNTEHLFLNKKLCRELRSTWSKYLFDEETFL
ncbi:MAG: LytTR family DNA-binding domain-containing protein [Acutalibacteraceae bacterium]|nr:LytTR family DNA-binding domain-containing protein [Acutalibacteraceae bacterium]